MNGKKLVNQTLRGKPAPRYPTGPLAVHFCAGLAEYSIPEYTLDADKLADSVIRYYETFEPDAVWVSADTWVTAEAMGATTEFPGDNQPLSGTGPHLVQRPEDVAAIPTENIQSRGRYPLMAEALNKVRARLGDDVFIVGCFDQSPFSTACQLMGTEAAMTMLYQNSGLLRAVMAKAALYASSYGRLLAEAGADMLSTGDSQAGLIGREHYKNIVLPAEQEVLNTLELTKKFLSLHICGDCSHILTDMIKSGANVLELDSAVETSQALPLIPNNIGFWGNIDPISILLEGSAEDVESDVERLITRVREIGRNQFVLSSGCTLAPGTPEANLRALLKRRVS